MNPFGAWDVTDGPVAPSLEPQYVQNTSEVILHLDGQSDDSSTCSDLPQVDYFYDYFHDDWTDASAGPLTVSHDDCFTYGHGILTVDSGAWMAGWTRKPIGVSNADQAMYSLYGTTWSTPTAIQDDGGQSDHVTIDYSGGNWVAGFHDFQGDEISLEHDPGGVVVKDIATGGSDPNWPSLQIAGSAWKVGWVQPASNGDGQVFLSGCTSNCMATPGGSWTTTTAFTYTHPAVSGNPVAIAAQSFFELLIADDGTLHALWQDLADSNGGNHHRVMYAERCGSNWTAPVQILDDAANLLFENSLRLGRPHMVLDDENDVVHVAFVETPTWDNFSSSAVVWGRHHWTCP